MGKSSALDPEQHREGGGVYLGSFLIFFPLRSFGSVHATNINII
jgi:hypothetical protein